MVNQLDQFGEDIVDTDAHLSRNFEEETASSISRKASSKFFTLLSSDNSLVIKIALVTNKDHRNIIRILNTDDLLVHIFDIGESTVSNDRINQDETLTVLHVQISHSSELFSTSSIENFEHALVTVDFDLLTLKKGYKTRKKHTYESSMVGSYKRKTLLKV